jgi:hypothetical protein
MKKDGTEVFGNRMKRYREKRVTDGDDNIMLKPNDLLNKNMNFTFFSLNFNACEEDMNSFNLDIIV